MALTIVKNLTDISACENTTNWSGSPTAGTISVREGTNSLGAQVSNTTSNFVFTLASANMTNQRVYIWVNVASVLDTTANGGLGIIVGDVTNQRAYYVGGSDSLGFSVGGFQCLVLDLGNLPSSFAQVAGAGAPTISAITRVGIRFKTIVKAQGTALNCFWDMVRYGTGLTVYGGTSGSPGTFQEIATDDASTAAGKAYGIIRRIQPGVFGIQGDIIFGDSAGTNSLYFKDSNSIVLVEDRVIGAGTPTPIRLTVTGNATGSDQRFEMGTAVSSGDDEVGSQPVTFLNTNIVQPCIFDASNSNVKHCLLYGTTFRSFKYTSDPAISFSSNATNGPNHHLSGCTFDNNGMVDVGRTVVRNCFFSGVNGIGTKYASMLWNANIDIKNCTYLNNTDADSDVAHGIKHDTAGTFTYTNMKFTGNEKDIWFSPGSGNLVINSASGSNPSTSTNDSSGTVTINNTITYTISGLQTGSEVRIFRASDDVALDGIESSSTTFDYSYNYSGDVSIYVYISHLSYEWLAINDTLVSTDKTTKVFQRVDRNYSNP